MSDSYSDQLAVLAKSATFWRNKPMRSWPAQAFAELKMEKSPYEPGETAIRAEALMKTQGFTGPIVQCGVYQGASLAVLTWLLSEWKDSRNVYGFDSFEGLPEPTGLDYFAEDAIENLRPTFVDSDEREVGAYLDALGFSEKVELVGGWYSETIPKSSLDDISVLILDCDLYDSYMVALENFYDRMASGGWIVFDEYFSPKWPGARRAVDDFFSTRPEKPLLAEHLLSEDPYERWYIIRE